MKQSSRVPAVLIGSLLVVASVTSARAAAVADEPPAVTVQFTKAELLDHAGVVRVHRRLQAAAALVCHAYESRELARKAVFDRCVEASLSRAVSQIHDPALTAYHERRTGYQREIAAVNGTQAAAP
ncbi:MAG: UrcA family protein [Steroidobacteraceae bacterium]